MGLTGVRAAVLDEGGRLLRAARRSLSPRLAPGRAEQDPAAWLGALFEAGRDALGGGEVDAVGVAALGPAPVLVDEALQPLTPALLFALDRRAESQRAALGATHDHALPKLRWWQERGGEAWREAAWALDATGFLVASLTGVPAMDGITRADYFLNGAGPDVALPEPAAPDAVAGGLTPAAAAALGLPAGTPVSTGTYDTFADVAAAGVRAPGDGAVLLGSTLIVCRAVAATSGCEGLETSAYPGDGVLLGGWTASAGSALAWAERELGPADDPAALPPGAGGLVALPYLAGERTPVWDPDARGLVLGLTLQTTRAELRRALVDAVALSARDHAERLRVCGVATPSWRAGGGGTRNDAWLHATCDALDAPVEVAAHAGEAIGPALLALRSVGADPPSGTERVLAPDAERAARLDALYAIYRELHPLLGSAMHRLGALAEAT